MPGLVLVTAPTEEPITLAEARAFLRLPADATGDSSLQAEENSLVNRLIAAARRQGETVSERSFVTTTWRLKLNAFPASGEPIRLPRPPLISVSSITYIAVDGTSTTLTSTLYSAITSGEVGEVWEAYGESWPSTRDQQDAVTVNYTAGYGAQSALPEDLKVAVGEVVRHWYERGESGDMPAGALRIFRNYWPGEY